MWLTGLLGLMACLLLLMVYRYWMENAGVNGSAEEKGTAVVEASTSTEDSVQKPRLQEARQPEATQPRIVIRPQPVLEPDEQAFIKSLKPRRVPAREPLQVPEGHILRLVIKLADDLSARSDGDGRLILHGDKAEQFQNFSHLAENRKLKFHRIHTAPDEEIAALTRRAAMKSGVAQPDLAALVEVKIPQPERDQIVALAHELHALPEVEWAELEALDRLPPPPAYDILPVTPLLSGLQAYREEATGVNMAHVWNRYGIRGDSRIRVTDCEYDLNMDHEDLEGLVQMQPNVVSRYQAFGQGHGTSVLGILASGWNEYGTMGGAPDCDFWFYPESSTLTTGSQNRVACVTAAIAASGDGDMVILEMQTGGPGSVSNDYVPAEYTMGVWTVVKAGTDAGVLTVAAAGNGNQNLDDSTLFTAYNARGDSGAIIVGAGNSARQKLSFSTYGSRVDLQGWGTGVFTTASVTTGTYVYGGDARQSYTAGFSGTSSATPIVASAAALLQSVALTMSGVQLSTHEIRTLLANTGRPQSGGETTPIGPLPDLKAAIDALFVTYPPMLNSMSVWGRYHLADETPDLTADPDGDGHANLLEYLFGTDPVRRTPQDATRIPRVSVHAHGSDEARIALEFHQPEGRTAASWVVQRSNNLRYDSWQDVIHEMDGAHVARVGEVIHVTLPYSDQERLFLRVKAVPN